MTNIFNLDKLIDHLSHTQPQNFNMLQWTTFDPDKGWMERSAVELVDRLEKFADCGTTACVAGHAALLKAKDEFLPANTYAGWRSRFSAKQWLGLTEEQAGRLFQPRNMRADIIEFSLDEAIDTLKNFRETSKVSWPRQVDCYGEDNTPWEDDYYGDEGYDD